MSYVHVKSESDLYTVGHYDPQGKWHPAADFINEFEAMEKVNFLNGGIDRGTRGLLAELVRELKTRP